MGTWVGGSVVEGKGGECNALQHQAGYMSTKKKELAEESK